MQLVMLVTRSEDSHLGSSVHAAGGPDAREFSGTLELMRAFEDLVPVDRAADAPNARGKSGCHPGTLSDGKR